MINPKKKDRVLYVGLTGPLGAGKSEVARVWEEKGAAVVSGDMMGRRALELDPQLREAISSHFGVEVFSHNGAVDRSRLADRAFASPQSARLLTELTFPSLYRMAWREMEAFSEVADVVVFDAALIFEWGVEKDFDRIVAVIAPEELLIERAMEKGLTRQQAIKRLKAQIPPKEKGRRAHRVIYNEGTLEELWREAEAVWKEISAWKTLKLKGQLNRASKFPLP